MELTLIDRLTKILEESGFTDISSELVESRLYKIKMKKISTFEIYFYLRNIGKSGWSDKKEIRRVQVAGFNVNSLPPTNHQSASMIIGIQNIFDEDICVVWNIYNYGNHSKNRSCYVKTANIYKAFTTGYVTTTDSNQKIWLCDRNNFDRLLNDYIMTNYISDGTIK